MAGSSCFISCDWGTTHLRVRLVERESGAVIAESKSSEGAAACFARVQDEGRSAAQIYAEVLRAQVTALLHGRDGLVTEIVVSGMACSRIGWKEIAYAAIPVRLDGADLPRETIPIVCGEKSLAVHLIGGLKTDDDILRGEEIETVGLAVLDPALFAKPARLILPGTHSKHVLIGAGRVNSFTTYMTGELYAHLRAMPTLKPCVEKGKAMSAYPAFKEGVMMSVERGFLASLFKTRSLGILGRYDPDGASSFLSGLLVGGELRECRTAQESIIVAAVEPFKSLYESAAAALGLSGLHFIPEKIVEGAAVAGHRQILL